MSAFVNFHVHNLHLNFVQSLDVSSDTNLAPSELNFVVQVLFIFSFALSIVGFNLFLFYFQNFFYNLEIPSLVGNRLI